MISTAIYFFYLILISCLIMPNLSFTPNLESTSRIYLSLWLDSVCFEPYLHDFSFPICCQIPFISIIGLSGPQHIIWALFTCLGFFLMPAAGNFSDWLSPCLPDNCLISLSGPSSPSVAPSVSVTKAWFWHLWGELGSPKDYFVREQLESKKKADIWQEFWEIFR